MSPRAALLIAALLSVVLALGFVEMVRPADASFHDPAGHSAPAAHGTDSGLDAQDWVIGFGPAWGLLGVAGLGVGLAAAFRPRVRVGPALKVTTRREVTAA